MKIKTLTENKLLNFKFNKFNNKKRIFINNQQQQEVNQEE